MKGDRPMNHKAAKIFFTSIMIVMVAVILVFLGSKNSKEPFHKLSAYLVTSLYPIKHIMPVFSSICYINGVKNRNEATKMIIFNLFLHKNPILSFKNYSYIIYA